MSKNTNISELINYISVNGSGDIVMTGNLIMPGGAQAATQTYVTTAISNLVASSPATLDTLNELALALGSDPNFATTIATSIGTKQAQLNGTGFVKVTGTTVSYDNSTYLTTATASSTYVPYTGATGNVNLGVYNLAGGNVNINGGGSGGGALRLKQFGSSEANLEGYNSISTLTSGVFYFTSSASVPNFKNFVLNPSGLTDNTLRTYTLPDASGTLALTSNIPSVSGVYLPLAGGTLTGNSYIVGGYFGVNINTVYSPLTVKGSNISWGETVTYYPSTSGYITLAFRLEGADVTTGTWAFGKQSTADSGGVQYLQIAKNGLTGSSLHRVDAVQTWDPANGNSYFGFKVGIGTTTPSDTLQVVGSSRWGTSTNNIVSYADGGGVYMELVGTNSNQKQLRIQGINNANNRYSAIRLEAGIEEIAFNTADLERMRIRSSGAVTRPYQPAFLAYNNSGFTVTGNGWYNVSNAITSEAYDVASNYGTSTAGRFVAPVAGRYLFYAGGWSSYNGTGERYAWCARVNDGSLGFISGGNYCIGDTPLSAYSIVLNLAAGDYVDLWVFSAVTANWGGGSHYIWWGGYLL